MYSLNDDPKFWQHPDRFTSFAESLPQYHVRGSLFTVADQDRDDAPMAVILDFQPGYVITRHTHDCHRFEVILRGSVQVDGRTYGPGDVMVAKPNEFYGPKVVGPDGATTCEVFEHTTGMIYRFTENEDGTVATENLLERRAR
jgi:anti-sigma factor ChrR (cupin superfamily)